MSGAEALSPLDVAVHAKEYMDGTRQWHAKEHKTMTIDRLFRDRTQSIGGVGTRALHGAVDLSSSVAHGAAGLSSRLAHEVTHGPKALSSAMAHAANAANARGSGSHHLETASASETPDATPSMVSVCSADEPATSAS